MKKANPKAVGAFILGGLAITIAVIVIFGSGIFSEKSKFVAFFPNSLQGLRVGSSVELRGVEVGAVTRIDIRIDNDLKYLFPVTFEIQSDRLQNAARQMVERGIGLDNLIDMGLRAQLNSVSFVTGQQSIQLDFFPDSPENIVDSEYDYPQIPTISSRAAEFENSIQDVLAEASKVLSDINNLLSDENQKLISEIIVSVHKVTADADTMIKAFTQTAESINKVADRADRILADNEDGIRDAITQTAEVEERIGLLANSLQSLVDDNSRSINQFTSEGLVEITNLAIDAQAAVEQFRRVMEEMERDPARFFLGSPGEVRGE